MSSLQSAALGLCLGSRSILSDVTMTVDGGEVVGLIGANGSGKTTLMRALAGVVAPATGSITLDGRPLAGWSRESLARHRAYLPQRAHVQWPISVRDLVALGRLPHRGPWERPSGADADAVAQALARTGLDALADRRIDRLSGGEQARALVARALSGRPKLLLADEPAAGLDPAYQLDLMRLFRTLAQEGVAVLVTLHDLTLAARFCDRVVLLAKGGVYAFGRPADVLSPQSLADCFAIRALLSEANGERYVVPWDVVGGRP
ncbi:MAG: ABC transporter ATP-binding protein [Alphaproteobacteria bacterium]